MQIQNGSDSREMLHLNRLSQHILVENRWNCSFLSRMTIFIVSSIFWFFAVHGRNFSVSFVILIPFRSGNAPSPINHDPNVFSPLIQVRWVKNNKKFRLPPKARLKLCKMLTDLKNGFWEIVFENWFWEMLFTRREMHTYRAKLYYWGCSKWKFFGKYNSNECDKKVYWFFCHLQFSLQ